MVQTSSPKTVWSYHDWRSKLTDGVLTAVALFATWFVVSLTIQPVDNLFGPPGLLVYALILLAGAMLLFQQSLIGRRPDNIRAWYGIAGGLLAWLVMEVSMKLGLSIDLNPASLILLTMMALIVMALWRNVLPVGARFFSLTLLLNWAEVLLMNAQAWLAKFSPVFAPINQVTGILAVLAAIFTLGWILIRSRRKLQRVTGGLAIWLLASLALYMFQGGLF